MAVFLNLIVSAFELAATLYLPLTAMSIVAIACITIANWHSVRCDWRRASWRCIVPAIVPLGMLLFALNWLPNGPERPEEETWLPSVILLGLFLSHVPLAAVLAWSAGKNWPLVMAASAFWGALSVSAWAVATMAISGVWL
jgi:hypothetical protein